MLEHSGVIQKRRFFSTMAYGMSLENTTLPQRVCVAVYTIDENHRIFRKFNRKTGCACTHSTIWRCKKQYSTPQPLHDASAHCFVPDTTRVRAYAQRTHGQCSPSPTARCCEDAAHAHAVLPRRCLTCFLYMQLATASAL